MKPKRGNLIIIINILISITAFLQLQPYFIWRINLVKSIYTIIIFIVGYILILSKSLKIEGKRLILLLFAIFITVYINYNGLKMVIVNLIFTIPLFIYILTETENKRKIYHYFSYIFAVALVPGIIVYIFHILNINFSWSYLEPLNPLKTEAGMYYEKYLGAITLVNPHSSSTGKLYRLCGMFDEPGVIGTISALILAGNGYQIKKNYINIILFIGGVLSFSLFFYIITIFYYIISAFFEKKYKNIIIVMIFLTLVGIFSTGIIKNDFIYNNVVQRMTIQDGKLQGDNRTTEYFESRFNEFLESGVDTVLFGMGSEATHSDKLLEASASWKKFVFELGFVGLTVLILFLFVATSIFNKTKTGIILFLVMVASIYQRPGVFDLPNILIFFGGLLTKATLDFSNFDIKMRNSPIKGKQD